MTAVHIRTYGMYCDACTHRLESRIEQLSGVKAARADRGPLRSGPAMMQGLLSNGGTTGYMMMDATY